MKILNITVIHVLFAFSSQLILNSLIAAQSPVPQGNTAVKIADGFEFVEGPVWLEGTGLLFSDIPANTVYVWSEEEGASSYLNPSGNSNGLALDAEGRLILAQHGHRQVSRIETSGTEMSLATHYNGMRLNSPNDLDIKSDGAIFFTDPPYGLSNPDAESETGFSGIYRLSPAGEVQLLDSTLYRPNGIAFSPDETKLYVSDSESRIIYVWDVVNDSLVTNKQQFASMDIPGYTDGMKVDDAGNVFSTGPVGIWVFSPSGVVLDTIPVPGQTSNCAWGPDKKMLYITSGDAVYVLSLEESQPLGNTDINNQSETFNNYPNPFKEVTNISFQLNKPSHVYIDIYNFQGENLKCLINDDYLSGTHLVTWQPQEMKSGIYLIKYSAANVTYINKCLFVR